MKIDVPGYAVVGWLCVLPQEWPSARGRPPLPSAGRIGRLGRGEVNPHQTSRRRPSDVIFPKDVQSDNPGWKDRNCSTRTKAEVCPAFLVHQIL
jgi:hypothetical protein